MLIRGAKVYLPSHDFEFRDVLVKNGVITAVEEPGRLSDGSAKTVDATGLMAIPGLVDLHFHGAMRADFCDATPAAVKTLAEYEAAHGILAICPATMTMPEEQINAIIDAALKYKEDYDGGLPVRSDLVGINLEGPFISKNKIGAQNPEFVIPPDAEMIGRLLDRSKGLVKTIAIAPETENAMECISRYKDSVVFSIAHTEADYDTAMEAFDRGAAHVTHLFNAMPGISHRKPGPIPAAVESGAEAELICDGIHVHPAMVRLAFDMFGPDRIILISDSMRALGLKDGVYDLGGQNVSVTGNRAVLADGSGTIAGSVTNLFDCMRTAVKFGVRPEDAVRAASENPAVSLGIADRYGKIAEGAIGHFLLVNKDFELVKVV